MQSENERGRGNAEEVITAMTSCSKPGCIWRDRHAAECVDKDCRGCVPRLAERPYTLCTEDRSRLPSLIATAGQVWYDLAQRLAESPPGSVIRIGAVKEAQPGLRLQDGPIFYRERIRNVFMTWSVVVAKAQSVACPGMDVAATAVFLVRHIDYIARQSWAGLFAFQTQAFATGAPFRAAYPVRDAARHYELGACPNDECSGTVKMIIRRWVDGLPHVPSIVVCSDNADHMCTGPQWFAKVRFEVPGDPLEESPEITRGVLSKT